MMGTIINRALCIAAVVAAVARDRFEKLQCQAQ
jgi:hypothetical protein